MSKFVGRRVSAAIAKETVRGAGPAGNTFYALPFDSFSFDDKIDETVVESAIGRIESPHQSHVVGKHGEGDFEGEVRDQSIGLLLFALYGTKAVAGPTDSAYTHTFTTANTNQHQSLAMKVVDPNQTILFKLLMLDKLSINVTLDEVVKFTAGFMSKPSAGSSGSVTFSAENKFTRKGVSLKVAADTSSLTAASSLSPKSVTLNFSKNLKLDNVLRTAGPEDILNQTMQIDGEITLNYEDQTWKNYMLNGTSKALRLRLTNPDVTIGSSTNPYLNFDFDEVNFFDWEPDRALDDITSQTISFRANYNLTNSSQSSASLVNTVVSY